MSDLFEKARRGRQAALDALGGRPEGCADAPAAPRFATAEAQPLRQPGPRGPAGAAPVTGSRGISDFLRAQVR